MTFDSSFEMRATATTDLLSRAAPGSAEHDVLTWYRSELEAFRTHGVVRVESTDHLPVPESRIRIDAALAHIDRVTLDAMRDRVERKEADPSTWSGMALKRTSRDDVRAALVADRDATNAWESEVEMGDVAPDARPKTPVWDRARAFFEGEFESDDISAAERALLEAAFRDVLSAAARDGRLRARSLTRLRRMREIGAPEEMLEREAALCESDGDVGRLTCGFDWAAERGRTTPLPIHLMETVDFDEATWARMKTLGELADRDVPSWMCRELGFAEAAGETATVARLSWSATVTQTDAQQILSALGFSPVRQKLFEKLDVDPTWVFEPIVGALVVACALVSQEGIALLGHREAHLLLRGEDALSTLEATFASLADAPLETWVRGVRTTHPVRHGMLELAPAGHFEIASQATAEFRRASVCEVEAQRCAIGMEIVRQERLKKLATSVAPVTRAGGYSPTVDVVFGQEADALRELCIARATAEPMCSPDTFSRMLFSHVPPVAWPVLANARDVKALDMWDDGDDGAAKKSAHSASDVAPRPLLFDLLYLPPAHLADRLAKRDFSLWKPLLEGIAEGAVPPAPHGFVRLLMEANADPEHWLAHAGEAGANMGSAYFTMAIRARSAFASWFVDAAIACLPPKKAWSARLSSIQRRPSDHPTKDARALFHEVRDHRVRDDEARGHAARRHDANDDDAALLGRIALVWAARALEVGAWAEAFEAATEAFSCVTPPSSSEKGPVAFDPAALLAAIFGGPSPETIRALAHRLLGAAVLGLGRVDDAFDHFALGFTTEGGPILHTKRFLKAVAPLDQALLDVAFAAQFASGTDDGWRTAVDALAARHPLGDRIRERQDALARSLVDDPSRG